MSHLNPPAVSPAPTPAFNIESIRSQFPILNQTVHGKPLVYLDNAASTQKPRYVLDRIVRYYESENANIHRGVHYLSETATRAHDAARETVARFINASSTQEVVFVRGCTEAINLVAATWGRQNIAAGDEIVLTAMEHHSNIVPWQILAQENGAVIRVAPMNERGELEWEAFLALLNERTRLVSAVYVSNALGTINPIRQIITAAHAVGAKVLVDAAQAAPHLPLDVQALDCDFLAFSGHKVYGPTGTGVLFGKRELLDAAPPYQGGGDMISSVTWDGPVWNALPYKFEAGTPDICGAIALAAALEWITETGIEAIERHEAELTHLATSLVSEIPSLQLVGTAKEKAAVVSFVVPGLHPNDIGSLLDANGIAIRTGHHCAQPALATLGLNGTARASFAVYNTREEVEFFASQLARVVRLLS